MSTTITENRVKRYCESCRKRNGGIIGKFYTNGEQNCEVDGFYLYPFTGSFSGGTGKTETKAEVKTAAAVTAKPAASVTAKSVTAVSVKPAAAAAAKPVTAVSVKPVAAVTAKPASAAAVKPVSKTEVRPETKAKPEAKAANGSVVKDVFAKRKLTGMQGPITLLEHYYSEWDTEVLKKAVKTGAKEDRTIANMHFLIVGDELTGKTEIAKGTVEILKRAGIRSNEEPEIIRERDFEALLGDTGALDSFKDKHNGKTVLIDGSLDEAFLSKEGKADADANKISDLLFSVQYLKGSLTLIFELSEALKDQICRINPKVDDHFLQIPIGRYSEDEMYDLTVKRITEDFGYRLSEGARERIRARIRQESFEGLSQGRFIVDLFDDAGRSLRKRLESSPAKSKEDRYTFTAEDIRIKTFDENAAIEALRRIESRTGQENLKRYAREVFRQAKENRERVLEGRSIVRQKQQSIILEGDAGSGKTTSTELIAGLLYACGVIDRPIPVVVSAADLQKDTVGGTPRQVKNCFSTAKGGLLVIDEAYSLANAGSFGQDIVDTVTHELGKDSCDVIVVLIGYPGTLDPVLKMNKGMKRRFPVRILLEDYSLKEMTEIFINYAKENGISTEEDAKPLVSSLIERKSRTQDFGNAGGVINLVDDLIHSGKTAEEGDRITKRILLETIDDTDGSGIEGILKELDSMIGINAVKTTINVLVKRMKGKKKQVAAGLAIPEAESYNMIFEGPPGTGKTTVCRLVARLYAALGLLKYSDRIVEVSGKDFIGEYVGKTEGRVKDIVQKAEGGVLYIDEVYQMDNGTVFGQAAIDGLCDLIEARGNSLMVIISGYRDKMEEFLRKNPGLESRFPCAVSFDPYSEEELWEIFLSFLKRKQVRFDDDPAAEAKVKKRINDRKSRANFGNGRDMRNLAEKCIENLQARIGSDDSVPIEDYNLIIADDIPDAA
ncbi:MAG: AAA family ATPase [Lachnospiraceae bacterium]|nr:AAA family ATPase [Lachnospiraceae bacterium]